ncbi:sigma 54-interacting transcriptional regulator [Candidatus Latescibacterota bacterium]
MTTLPFDANVQDNSSQEYYMTGTSGKKKEDSNSLRSRVLLTHALRLVNAPLVVEERLELLARIIAEYLSVDDVNIFLKELDSETLLLRTSIGLNPLTVGNLRVPIGNGITGLVAQTRKYIASRNIMKDPRNFYSVYYEDEKYPSILSFPITSDNELIGVINIRTKIERDFTKQEAEELNNFTASIAGSITNAQVYEKLEYKSRLLELSIKIAEAVTSSLDLDVILDEIAWEISSGFAIQGVLIQLMNEDGTITKSSSHGLKTSFVKNYTIELSKNCMKSGEPKIRRLESEKPFGTKSQKVSWHVCIPMTNPNKTLGVISLFGTDNDKTEPEELFLSTGIDVFLHIAGLAALAIENATIHSELKRLAQEEKKQLDIIGTMYSRISAIFDSIMDGIIAVDKDGIIYDFNEIARKSLSLTDIDKTIKNIDAIISYKSPITSYIAKGRELTNCVVTMTTPSENFAAMFTMRTVTDTSGEQRGSVISFRPMEETVKLLSRFNSQRPRFTFDDIIGKSSELAETVRLAKLAAESNSNILIVGESGTGKELFSQAIHNASPVADGPFIPVNCAAIPKDLIESELFGYSEGAFTGARKGGYIGKFEQATGGTIFLDEIGDMPLDLQVKLLRVLQEKVIQPVGSEHIIPISTRIISATNRNLENEIQESNFREELYFRINVISIEIPPLRHRKIDIAEFVRFFIEKFSQFSGKEVKNIDKAALSKLLDYSWRGNVRELENAIEHAVLMAQSPVITPDDLPTTVKGPYSAEKKENSTKGKIEQAQRQQIESSRKLYQEALLQSGGDVDKAAKNLELSRATFYRHLKKYGLTEEILKIRQNIKNDTKP